MADWTSKKLKELGVMRGAGADKLTQPGEKPIRLVNYMDVYTNHRISNAMTFQEVTATDREIAECNLKRGDVLFTPSSETADDIAHAAVVVEDIPGAVYSYHLTRFRPHNPEYFDTEFLGYLFNNSVVHRYFWARACGLTRFTLNRADFNNLTIHYPEDKAEQTHIRAAMGTVDSAMDAARDSIAKAERLQRGLMQQLLTGRLKPDGTPRTPNDFHETKLGRLPKTWAAARIKDFGEVSTGKTPPTANEANFGGDLQFIAPGDLGANKWLRRTERSLSALGAEFAGVLPANTVCVVCIGATIGKVGLTERPACTNQQINSVVCHQNHSPEYLYYAIRHRAQHLLVIAGVNATPQINKSEFSKYRIPMPATPEEEAAIASRLAVFDDLVETKRQKIAALQQLKKSLMQNLLTGRVRLPVNGAAKREE